MAEAISPSGLHRPVTTAKAAPEAPPRVHSASDLRAKQLVWWKEPGRDPQLGDHAAWVISVNQAQDTVLIGFYKDPTAEREERNEIVSPRVLRPRMGAS